MRKLAEELVNYGKKKGASQIQISIYDSSEFSVEVRNQNIEKLQEAGSKFLSLKVIVDNKVATASSSDFKTDTLHKLIDNAVGRAQLSSKDDFAVLPENEPLKCDINKLQIYNEQLLAIPPEKKIALAKEIEKIGLADKRIRISDGSSCSSYYNEVIIANSNGFIGSFKNTGCSAGVGYQAGEGNNSVQDYWYESGHSFDVISNAEFIAKLAVERTTRLLGSKKVPTQNVPIILEPKLTGMILGFLSSCINGHSIYMKQSFLAGKLGEQIANESINIYDDPLLPKGHSTKPFDSEGVPTRKNHVIQNGKLNTYLLDTYSAKKLSMKSTGNAGGSTNFYLAPGTNTPEQIIKSIDKGLLWTKSIGQGTNSTTGDISKGAFGLWIENGQIAFPVSEITVSGNLGKILKDIVMIGNDLKFNQSTIGPTIKIAEMTVSGL